MSDTFEAKIEALTQLFMTYPIPHQVYGMTHPQSQDLARAAAVAIGLREGSVIVPADGISFGCHCDLEPHMKPDKCVLDENRPDDCIYAKGRTNKWTCGYWRQIAASPT